MDAIVACAAVRTALLAAEDDAPLELVLLVVVVKASGTTLLGIGATLLATANVGLVADAAALESDIATGAVDAADGVEIVKGEPAVTALSSVVSEPLACPPDVLTQNCLKTARTLPVARRDLHHHVILVEGVVDRRYRPLTEGVVQRVVDLIHRQSQPRRCIAVDRDIRLEPPLLLIGTDVCERRVALHRGQKLRPPFVDLGGIVAEDRVLIFCIARPAADANVLHRAAYRAGRRGPGPSLRRNRAITTSTPSRSLSGFSDT